MSHTLYKSYSLSKDESSFLASQNATSLTTINMCLCQTATSCVLIALCPGVDGYFMSYYPIRIVFFFTSLINLNNYSLDLIIRLQSNRKETFIHTGVKVKYLFKQILQRLLKCLNFFKFMVEILKLYSSFCKHTDLIFFVGFKSL